MTDQEEVGEQLKEKGYEVSLCSYMAGDIERRYRFRHYLSEVFKRKIFMKSGGFLYIEQTEAMAVIDVNTGKSIGKKNQEAHIKKINLEALSHLCVESFARIEFLGLGRSTPMASSLLNGVFTNSEKTTASILMTAFATISSILTNSKIKRITRTTSFDIRKIPKEKTIIYLKYPEYSCLLYTSDAADE